MKLGDFGPCVDCGIEYAGKWAVSGICLVLTVPWSLQCVIVAFLVITMYFFVRISMVNVRKMAKIRKRYNQAPHLSQDTNGKVTTSQ